MAKFDVSIGESNMKYIKTNSEDPYYNLAFEEFILRNFKDDDYVLLWQNDNAIVFGVNQNPLEEINMEIADEMGVKIVRRSTGGGAVYHDLGNLNFSYITDWDGDKDANYAEFLAPIIAAFAKIGLKVELKGRNDLILEGKKISGSAQRLLNGRILHHGTLLINSDLTKIGKVLNVSEDKIKSKGIKSVKSRVTNISQWCDEKVSIEDIKRLLLDSWFNGDINEVSLLEEDLQRISKLAEWKYRSWDWTYARSPKFSMTNKKRFSGGSIELNLEIEEGNIKDCLINGDFLSLGDVSEVEERLKNIKYDKDAIAEVLDEMKLNLYFGSITKEEILSCF